MRGASPDSEAEVAYYCFINLGWPPSKYANLPFRERALIAEMVARELRSRKEANKG